MSFGAEKLSKPEDGGEEREEEKAVDNELCQGEGENYDAVFNFENYGPGCVK